MPNNSIQTYLSTFATDNEDDVLQAAANHVIRWLQKCVKNDIRAAFQCRRGPADVTPCGVTARASRRETGRTDQVDIRYKTSIVVWIVLLLLVALLVVGLIGGLMVG